MQSTVRLLLQCQLHLTLDIGVVNITPTSHDTNQHKIFMTSCKSAMPWMSRVWCGVSLSIADGNTGRVLDSWDMVGKRLGVRWLISRRARRRMAICRGRIGIAVPRSAVEGGIVRRIRSCVVDRASTACMSSSLDSSLPAIFNSVSPCDGVLPN